jgi:uncharacterized protein YbjT (DUF2867 family)
MYVITGVTGNTGSVVANRLLAAGKKVRGISRRAHRLERLVQQGGEPFEADLTDREALADAFAEAEGVYVMIPPNPAGPDFRLHQLAVTEAVASALARAKVKYAVTLSSFGADKPEKTGPVVGLHRMEERLNRIDGLNVLHLRCGYFMENTLIQAQMIATQGVAIGPLLPELKVPMIATRDIGTAAAEALLKLNFTSHQTLELLGPRDITMHEVTTIIGNAIGKPDLKYIQATDEQARAGMQQMGLPADLVGLILEMATAMNTGLMKSLEARNAENTTPTTYETFVQEQFLPAYQGSGVNSAA